MDEWTSVTAEMPDDDITVLVWGRTMHAKYPNYHIAYHMDDRWLTWDQHALVVVSHWCDLPADPTEQKE